MSGEGAWSNQVVNNVTIVGSGGELLVYSPTQAAGNLVASIAASATTDTFGNHILAGEAVYSNSTNAAATLNAGFVSLYTGTLAGGWTSQVSFTTDGSGDAIILANGGFQVNATSFTANTSGLFTGNLTVNGALTVGGSTNTGASSNTGFFNTQGLASGSYGSTHQHTLPNFTTATHVHPL